MEFYIKQLFWSGILVFPVFAYEGGITRKNDAKSKILGSGVSQFGSRNEQQSQSGSSRENFSKDNSLEYHPDVNDVPEKANVSCSSDSDNCKIPINISQKDENDSLVTSYIFLDKAIPGAPTEQEFSSSWKTVTNVRKNVEKFHKPSNFVDLTVFKELFLKCLDKELYEGFCFEINKTSSDVILANISKLLQALCHKAATNSEKASCSFNMHDPETGEDKTMENSLRNVCALINFNEVDYMFDSSRIEVDTANFGLKDLKTSFCKYAPLNQKTVENGNLFKDLYLPFDLPLGSQRGVRFKMFYWTYVSAFLYAAYYLTSFLFTTSSLLPVFMNFILLQFFPDIIQSSIFNSFDLALSTLYSSL